MFDNNFGNCGPIFKILSPGDSYEFLYVCTTKISTSPAIAYIATLPCESQTSKNVTAR